MDYMDFFNSRKQELLQISHTNRIDYKQGLGVLVLTKNTETNNMDCSYIPINTPQLPKNLREEIIKMSQIKNTEYYFYFNDPIEPKLITMDMSQ
jgi:hypothetical protein